VLAVFCLPRDHGVCFSDHATFVAGSFEAFVGNFCPKLFQHHRLLIAAGAGTGKTKTLVHRVAHLILDGADPHRLLLLTFTRGAPRSR